MRQSAQFTLACTLSLTLKRGESMRRGRGHALKATNSHGYIYFRESSAIGQR